LNGVSTTDAGARRLSQEPTGWSCGIGTYLCRKQAGKWVAEEQNYFYGD
jgi:hypothetical protein